MSKFKVGDKVRVIENGIRFKEYFDSGKKRFETMSPGMLNYCGKTVTISTIYPHGYEVMEESGFRWTDEMFSGLATDQPRREFIVIHRSGNVMTAEHRVNREVIKSEKATCAPSDTFDFDTGAKLAFDRLIGREEPKPAPAPEPPKYYTGKVVCIESNNPSRVGIVASMKDGICSRGGWNRLSGIPYKSFDDFCSEWIDSKFAEAKE